jgi:hypothetical protein
MFALCFAGNAPEEARTVIEDEINKLRNAGAGVF